MCHSFWRGMRHPMFHHQEQAPGRGEREGASMRGGPDADLEVPGFGGGWGVRRPLRFLAHKLDLDQKQIGELARILDELKIERAQAEVDDRRARAEFADAVAGESFDAAKAGAAGERRVDSAGKLRTAVTAALRAIHALLRPEQRERFAYLIRTGTLAL